MGRMQACLLRFILASEFLLSVLKFVCLLFIYLVVLDLSCGIRNLLDTACELLVGANTSSSPTRDRILGPLYWERRVLPTGPPRKSLKILCLNVFVSFFFSSVVFCNFILYPIVHLKTLSRDICWVGSSQTQRYVESHYLQFTEQVSESQCKLKVHQWQESFLIQCFPLNLRETWFPKLKVTEQKCVFQKCGQSLDEYKAVL